MKRKPRLGQQVPPEIRVYVEGSSLGEQRLGSEAGDVDALRRSFHALLSGLPRQPAIRECGPRGKAVDRFAEGLARAGVIAILLVDSEAEVLPDETSMSFFRRMKQQNNDAQLKLPAGADDGNVYLMVQCMETWFLADPDAVANYYAPDGFNHKALPKGKDLERVPKLDVLAGLKKATKGEYNKRDGLTIVGLLNPNRVATGCPHFAAFRSRLQQLLS